MLRTLTLIAVVGAGSLCAPAFADDFFHVSSTDASGTRSIAVQYGDLDVSRADGAHALVVRLKQAAAKVCNAVQSGPVDIATYQAQTECMNKAMNSAVASANAPLVAEIYHNAEGMTASTGAPVSQ
jgi:UrcA family protein